MRESVNTLVVQKSANMRHGIRVVIDTCFGHNLVNDNGLRDGTTVGVALRARATGTPRFSRIDRFPEEFAYKCVQ